jgi:Flp pilus assembly protein TadG
MKTTKQFRRRKGNILVLSAVLLIVMFALLAFTIDLGYLQVAKTELQRTADSAAIAATWELIDPKPSVATPLSTLTTSAAAKAQDYALKNLVTRDGVQLNSADIVAGYLPDPSNPLSQLSVNAANGYNAVQVRVRKDGTANGNVPFFFAPVLGIGSASCNAQATAAFVSNFSGFQTPKDGSNLHLLPFALDEDTWCDLRNGLITDDNWTSTWNPTLKKWIVTPGPDGIKEVNLFPQGTGSPGNRGTVDIGSSNNSTADIARQIVHGISPADMAAMGGKMQFNEERVIVLNGDTGISAGVKDELASIIGQPRCIPIFRTVVGPGNNAQYYIVRFAGVRILDVHLTGKMSSKRVIIQPANIRIKGGIPATGPQGTDYIYSQVWLVR